MAIQQGTSGTSDDPDATMTLVGYPSKRRMHTRRFYEDPDHGGRYFEIADRDIVTETATSAEQPAETEIEIPRDAAVVLVMDAGSLEDDEMVPARRRWPRR